MLRTCAPTLLALTVASGFAAETDVRRDEQARAIATLIDMGAKLSADRQITAWNTGGYSDMSPSIKQALQDAYDQAFDPKFDDSRMKKYDAKGLPDIINDVTGRGGGVQAIVKMLNDSRRILDPDAPKPTVQPTQEKIVALNRTFKRLAATFEKEFATAVEEVKKNEKQEEEIWGLDEKREANKIRDIQFNAVMKRIEALKIFSFSHMALREAAFRGADFGLDPKPYNDAMAAFAKQYFDMISDWDFQWAEMHPELQLYCAVAWGECAKQKVKGASESDAEAAYFRVIDMDLEAIPAPARDSVRTVQALAWANMLRWRLEINTPESLARGVALFNDYKKRYARESGFQLTYKEDISRAVAIAQVYITGGRLFAASGDSASSMAAWGEVVSSNNPLSVQAKKWMGGSSDGPVDWGQESLPSDPSIALTVARSLIGEAQTANPVQARAYYLKAALSLRGAVLGLSTAAFEDSFVSQGPDVYRYYAYSLSQLGMPYHAGAAAFEGLRQVGSRIQGKTNPWQNQQGKWTKDGEKLQRLLSSALTYCSKLNSIARSSATKRMYDECVGLAEKIDPSVVGEGLKWMLVVNSYNEGNYRDAIDGARNFAKDYPPHFVKAASLMVKAQQALVGKLEKDTGVSGKAQTAEAQKELDETIGKLDKWLGKQTNDDETNAKIKPLRVAVISAKIRLKLNAGQYDAVFADLGPEFWAGRVDTDLAESMLKYLAQAVAEDHLKISGVNDAKTDKPKALDAPVLIAAWTRYQPVLRLWKKQSNKYFADDQATMKNSSYRLAQTAQILIGQADRVSDQPGVQVVSEGAKLAFADFIEPFVDENSRPTLILAVAQTLWDIGEKGRAVRLFELYKASLDNDPLVKAYRSDPDATVKQFAGTFVDRRETKDAWAEIDDLLLDPPGYLKDLLVLDANELKAKGEKRDFHVATIKVDALKKLIESQGHLDADTKAKMLESIAQLRQMTSNLAAAITIDSNLAQYYRETNQAGKAVALYRALYQDYDPLNPLFAEGYVEGVLQALAAGEVISNDVIAQAREVAGRNLRFFKQRPQDRDSYWVSYLQVFELSKFLGASEMDAIKKSLEFSLVNKSTPRHDLIAPPVPGDIDGVARPRHQLAVGVGKRFLDLFDEVKLPRPFRIDEISAGGKTIEVFVDSKVGPIEGVVSTNADGDDIIVIKLAAAAAPAAP